MSILRQKLGGLFDLSAPTTPATVGDLHCIACTLADEIDLIAKANTGPDTPWDMSFRRFIAARVTLGRKPQHGRAVDFGQFVTVIWDGGEHGVPEIYGGDDARRIKSNAARWID
jgi:hypothetical protein